MPIAKYFSYTGLTGNKGILAQGENSSNYRGGGAIPKTFTQWVR